MNPVFLRRACHPDLARQSFPSHCPFVDFSTFPTSLVSSHFHPCCPFFYSKSSLFLFRPFLKRLINTMKFRKNSNPKTQKQKGKAVDKENSMMAKNAPLPTPRRTRSLSKRSTKERIAVTAAARRCLPAVQSSSSAEEE